MRTKTGYFLYFSNIYGGIYGGTEHGLTFTQFANEN